jgi:putative redox protein
MKIEKIRFQGSQDYQLDAQLDLPEEGEPVAYALFAHCFACTKNIKAVSNINRAMTEAGIGVLRFDFTGLGESEGDFADTNFSSNVGDLLAAARFLESDREPAKILLGHSLGGAAVIQAARHLTSCVAVATIGAPSRLQFRDKLPLEKREDIERKGETEITIARRTFRIKKQFFEDLDQNNMEEHISSLGRPLLIFHSPDDEMVNIQNASQIFRAAKHPKSFVSLDGADHLLANKRDSRYVGAVVATWSSRYIGGEEVGVVCRLPRDGD